MHYKDMKLKDAAIQQRNDDEAFGMVTRAIANLSPHHYLRLRIWLVGQPTLKEWQVLIDE